MDELINDEVNNNNNNNNNNMNIIMEPEEPDYQIVKIYDYVPLTDIEKKYSIVVNLKQITKKKKVLGITKSINVSKKENPQCLICLDDTNELLQLNCNHYCCITCLCKWYRNNNDQNKDTCIYCKQNIIWSECKTIKKI